MLGMTEDVVDTDTEMADLLQRIADNVSEGKEITKEDMSVLDKIDGTEPVAPPTTINKPTGKERQEIKFQENYDMSLVTPDNKIDLLGLIDEIVDKKEKVWFWVADQLGMGEFNGIEMDAGPSYALDPTNLAANIIWASGMNPKSIANNVEKADYIFIISGSPTASKLFNKKVFDAFANKLGDFAAFKQEALALNPVKAVRDVLEKHDSWPSIRRIGADRKKLLKAIVAQENTPNTEFHKLVKSKDGFIDLNALRDGFYRDNDFNQNDVMMVLKPTEVGGKSEHSTYETNILGEVIGVPDVKLDAFEIMPESVRSKYEGKELGKPAKAQVVAPYGTGVKNISKPKQRQQKVVKGKDLVKDLKKMGTDGGFNQFTLNDIQSQDFRSTTKTIESILKNDLAAAEYIDGGKIRKFKSEATIPVIIDNKGEVRDGYNRLLQAVQDGKKEITVLEAVDISEKAQKVVKGKERQEKVVFKVEKQRIYKDDSSGVTFLTKGYGGRFINIPRKAVTIKDIDGLSQYQKPLVEVTMERDVYNKQPEARTVIDGKEKFVNQLDTIRGFKKIRLIKDTPDVKSTVQKVTALAQQNGISDKGFFPASLWNAAQLKTQLTKLGFGLKAAYKSYGDGALTGYYITKNGRKFNPPSNERMEVIFTNEDSNQEVVDKAREMDFSDASIKDYLQRVRKIAKDEVNALLEKTIDLFESIPAAFGNVEGGMNVGKEIFNSVNTELNKFIKKNKPTPGEKRVKGLAILESNPLFKEQPKSVQNELISAYDRSLQTTANRTVQKKVAAVRKAIRDFKDGRKTFKESKIRLKNLIRKALPKGEYSKAVVERVGNILAKASEKTFLTDSEKILEIVSNQREKQKKTLIGKIAKLVAAKAKKALTQSNKVRGKGLDAAGQQFFKSVKAILKAAVVKDGALTIQAIREKLSQDDVEVGGKVLNVRETLEKAMKGEKMTVKEQMLVEQIYALDTFGDIMNMSLEDVQNLYEGVKDVRAESIKRLAAKRLARVEAQAKLDAEADVQIKENYPFLFNEDGTLKDKNQLDQDWRSTWGEFNDRKIWAGLKRLVDGWQFTKITGLTDFMRQKIAHLGTLSNLLDNVAKGNNFFTENIYNRLNRMETKSLEGKQAEIDSVNKGLGKIANTIKGITKGYKEWKQKIPKGYRKIYIKGKAQNLTIDEMMRIYALSKNDIQRAKLEKMGYNADVLSQIQTELTPLATEFIDKAVEYLSNEYFEETNSVYRQVNDVNLGYVANYFPTRTLSPNIDNLITEDGGANFSGVFNAEYDSAFKQRVDRESDIDLGAGFTSVLESHIESMERYKAFAEGTKILNNLFKNPAVDTLIKELGVKGVMKNITNVAINPQSGLKQARTKIASILSRFTEYALSFKLIQIPKQATSFINALEDYSYRGEGKKTPGLDTLMFMVDMAKVIATLPQQIRKARSISPDFTNRLKQGLEGDVYGLESGSRTFKPLSNTQAKTWWKKFKIAAASPTIIGDVMGVMGYMANYNRNIANGMSKAEALQAFNNYNATQQSRRASDKNMLQLSGDELTRVFTMFGSTLFLQMNKVMSSTTNLMRALKEGRKADSQQVIKDSRALALNFAVANMLFIATANMFKLAEGEEDEEEALNKIKDAAMGLNLLYQIPLIGGASEEVINKIKGERGFGDDVINPYKSVARKISKGIKADSNFDTMRPIIEIIMGAQMDPFIGLYNTFAGEGEVDDNIYDMLGVSSSYQPGSSKKKSKSLKPYQRPSRKNK